MADISIRFRQVMNLAEQISQIADSMRNLAEGELFRILCMTKQAWQCESADLFCQKEVKSNEQLLDEAQKLEKLSKELEERAKAMYMAECTNSILAKTRIYI